MKRMKLISSDPEDQPGTDDDGGNTSGPDPQTASTSQARKQRPPGPSSQILTKAQSRASVSPDQLCLDSFLVRRQPSQSHQQSSQLFSTISLASSQASTDEDVIMVTGAYYS